MRLLTFLAVGGTGFLIQILTLTLFTAAAGWPYVPATAAAVEIAAVHNFCWHERWTWRDRGLSRGSLLARLGRYHATTAVVSIVGNLLLTAAFVEIAGAPAVLANAAAVGAMAAANFLVADRWVFARRAAPALLLMFVFAPVGAAEESPDTIAAWNEFVARAETRLHACRCEAGVPEGRTVDIPGGTIHQWRSSTFAPHTTVDEVLRKLMHPGTPPPQEDVLEARVLSRNGDALKVFLKLTRRAIVSVTYDTEHDVTFSRYPGGIAASRSIATLIREVGGRDRGFLWRLNSYWRYAQHGDGVRIDVESLSLSRRIPMLVRPAAAPVISRVGRESIIRTLEALRRFLERPDEGRSG